VPAGLVETAVDVWDERPFPRRDATASAACRPATSGTVTAAVDETDRVTVEPLETRVPAEGSSAKTVPVGAALGLVTIRATSPRCPSRPTASACVLCTTSGTRTVVAP
jgi:hypothetical protein